MDQIEKKMKKEQKMTTKPLTLEESKAVEGGYRVPTPEIKDLLDGVDPNPNPKVEIIKCW